MNIDLSQEELNELKCILNEYKGVDTEFRLQCMNLDSILKKIENIPLETIHTSNK